jgi:putative phosphoesterase
MLLGVVSDTHGQVQHTQRAVRMLESLQVAEVIHCGDIGSTDVVEMFARWPTHFVFGNVDYDRADLSKAITVAGQTCHDVFGSLELVGNRLTPAEDDASGLLAFLHGDDSQRLKRTIEAGRWQLVCHGHTHVSRLEQIGSTLILNPGAIYRARPHSIAVIELPALKATIVPLD